MTQSTGDNQQQQAPPPNDNTGQQQQPPPQQPQENTPQVNVSHFDTKPLMDALQALPEKLAETVKSMVPQQPAQQQQPPAQPQPQPQPPSQPQPPNANQPATRPAETARRRRTFGEVWFGVKES